MAIHLPVSAGRGGLGGGGEESAIIERAYKRSRHRVIPRLTTILAMSARDGQPLDHLVHQRGAANGHGDTIHRVTRAVVIGQNEEIRCDLRREESRRSPKLHGVLRYSRRGAHEPRVSLFPKWNRNLLFIRD